MRIGLFFSPLNLLQRLYTRGGGGGATADALWSDDAGIEFSDGSLMAWSDS